MVLKLNERFIILYCVAHEVREFRYYLGGGGIFKIGKRFFIFFSLGLCFQFFVFNIYHGKVLLHISSLGCVIQLIDMHTNRHNTTERSPHK